MQKRIALWDNLKLFLIFLVVLGHLANGAYSDTPIFERLIVIIYTFHMPAFIFVSGLFSKKAVNGDKFPGKKVFAFIMLYFMARIVNFLPNMLLFHKKINFDIFSVDSMPWYMLAMAMWYAITWAVKNFDSKYILTVSIVIACFAGYMTGDTDFLAILRVITFFPFFYCGYILEPEKVESFTAKTPVRIFSALYLAAFSIGVFIKYNFASKFYPLVVGRQKFTNLDKYMDYAYILRFLYYIGIGLMVLAVISLCPRREFKITKLGKRTLQIYVFHRAVLYILDNAGVLKMIQGIGTGWEFIIVVLAAVITAVLSLKIFTIPIDFVSNPKLKKKTE